MTEPARDATDAAPDAAQDAGAIAEVLRDLAHRRGAGKTFCPSEAARTLAPNNWRPLMNQVRQVAANLSDIEATQKGASVDPREARGPIRLGLKP
ncbi:MAG: DUF3253 domain-containing protein [Pseudomonadota bacterium]